MSDVDVRNLTCPHCGGLVGVTVSKGVKPGAPRDEGRGEERPGPSSPPGAGEERANDVRYEDGWELECSAHGWRKARVFESDGKKPAVVKCTARREDGTYCVAKVPLGDARRRAGISDGMTRDG